MQPDSFHAGLRNALAICIPFWAALIASAFMWPLTTGAFVAGAGILAGFALSVRLTYDGLRGLAERMA